MFKRISIILLILFTLLAFTIGVSATGVFVEKAADASYIRWVKSDGTVILQINEDGTTTYGGTVDYSQSIQMEDTDAIFFDDTGMYIRASADGILTIGSDGTLVTTVTTSHTLTTPTFVHSYDGSNLVTQTVSSVGVVKVTTTGSSDSYEIETGDGAIVLDADTGITLDSGDSTIGIIGDILGSNAAGPGIIDEAATSTNPTLCPNKADEAMGLGWVSSGVMSIIIGGGAEYGVSATGIDMNANALTELGTVAGTKPITLTPDATATTYLDFVLESTWLGGTLIDMNWGTTSCTLTATTVFLNIDCAYVNVGSERSVTAIDINLPQMTWSAATFTHKAIEITAQGALVLSGSGTITWTGIDITIPAITQTAGTVTASGQLITGSAISTGGTVYGIRLAGVFTTGIQVGLTGAGALDLVAYGDRCLEIYASTNATGGNVMPLYVSLATDGTCKARAAEFVLTPTAALGQWATVVKTYFDLTNASGGLGLLASLCAEILLPAEAMSGTITVLELELVSQSGFVSSAGTGSNCVAYITTGLTGTAKGEINEHGFFLNVQGLTAGTGDMLFGNTLKCAIGTTTWYLPFSSAEDSYTTIYPVDITVAAGTALDIGTSVIGIDFTGTYTTGAIRIGQSGTSAIELAAYDDFNIASYTACAAQSGTQKHNIFQGIMDGAGALGRVVYVELTVDDVAAGSYVNAFKAQLQFDATGSAVGLASVACLEMVLTTGAQVGGTYALLELEVNCPATWAPSGALYNLIYIGIAGATATTFDTHFNFFRIVGASVGQDKFFYNNTLRCRMGDTYWYLPLSSAQGGYTTAFPIVSTYAGTVLETTSTITSTDHIVHLTVNDNSTISSGRNSGLYVEYVVGAAKSGGSECNAISVRGTLTDNVGSFYAYHALVNITSGKNVVSTVGLFYGYMSDVGSGSVNHIWAMKLDRVTTTQATGRDMFLGFKGHGGSGRAKTIFYIEGTSNKIAEQFIMTGGAFIGASDWFVPGINVASGYTCVAVLRLGFEAIVGAGVTTQYYIPVYTAN